MRYSSVISCATAAAALVASTVVATATAAEPTPESAPTTSRPAIASDVGPAPAEERDSSGAIILEHSPVRAQKSGAFERSRRAAQAAHTALRAATKARLEAESAPGEDLRDTEEGPVHNPGPQ